LRRAVAFVDKDASGKLTITADQARELQTKNDPAACQQALQKAQGRTGGGQAQNGSEGNEQGADIVVQQPAPTITVEQPPPQISVQQVPPNVSVRQRQPQIVVHQPAPVVRIDIPQPEITVRMPPPEVNVEQASPEVAVQEQKPTVQVTQPEAPQVQVGSGDQASVSVAKPPAAKVQVEQVGEPQVTYERAEPQVTINQSKEPPKIRIEHLDEQASATNRASPETTGSLNNSQNAGTAAGSVQQIAASDLKGLKVSNENGEQVGTADGLVKSSQDNKIYVVIRQDGFMGLDKKMIALAVDDLILDRDVIIIPNVNNEQIAAYPAFQPSDQFSEVKGETPTKIRTATR